MGSCAFLLVVILCYSSQVTDADYNYVDDYVDGLMATTAKPVTVCKVNKTEPLYHPNVYECLSTEDCCINEGAASCCAKDIDSTSLWQQVILWGALIGMLLLVGIFAYCYFNDNYCCDPDPDSDGGMYCCCIPASSVYKKRTNVNEFMFPDEVWRNKVDDPIFGPMRTPNDVPQYASVDAETMKRLQLGKGGAFAFSNEAFVLGPSYTTA